MKLRNNKNEEGNSDSRVFKECRILFLLWKRKELILSKSNCLKIVPEGKRKMRDGNRNKYRSFKSWERGTISWDTHRENLTSCGQAGRDWMDLL